MWRLAVLVSTCIQLITGSRGFVHHIRPSARVIIGQKVEDHALISFYCTVFVEFEDDGGTRICGCALIGGDRAITAAHCLVRVDPTYPTYVEYAKVMYVRTYGGLNLKTGGSVRIDLSTLRIPQTFRYEDMYHDIAAFNILGGGVNFTVTNTLRSAWDDLTSWDKLFVVGVGMDRNRALSLGAPREAYLSRRSCSNPVGYGNLLPWPSSTYHDDICAGPFSPCDADSRCADSCGGDSGGPLFQRESDGTIRIYGLVSRGAEDCGRSGGQTGIYTPMDTHREFIANESSADFLFLGRNDEPRSDSSGSRVYNEPLAVKILMLCALFVVHLATANG